MSLHFQQNATNISLAVVALFFVSSGPTSAREGGAKLQPNRSAPCDNFAAWNSFIGNTSKPYPTCFGSIFSRDGLNILSPSVTGTPSSRIGDERFDELSGALVQMQSVSGNDKQNNGLKINWISATGGGGAKQTGYNARVAASVAGVLVPGGSNMWGLNIDVAALRGVGRYPFFAEELDMTNFNGPYSIGTSDSLGVNATSFWTWLSSFPNTAGLLASAGNQKGAATHMMVQTTAGSAEAIVLQPPPGGYGGLYQGEPVSDDRGRFPPWTRFVRQRRANGGAAVVLNAPALTTGATALTFTPTGTIDLILINSEDVASDNTYFDGGNSQTSLNISGHHQVGVSFGPGVEYAFAMAPGRAGCFNGLTACFAYQDNQLGYAGNLSVDGQITVTGNLSTKGLLAAQGHSPVIVAAAGRVSLSPGANDVHGSLEMSRPTDIKVIFANAHKNAPDCIVASSDGVAPHWTSKGGTAGLAHLQIQASAEAGSKLTYICMGD